MYIVIATDSKDCPLVIEHSENHSFELRTVNPSIIEPNMAKYQITRGYSTIFIAPIQGFHSCLSSCCQDTSHLWTWNRVRSRGSCLRRSRVEAVTRVFHTKPCTNDLGDSGGNIFFSGDVASNFHAGVVQV